MFTDWNTQYSRDVNSPSCSRDLIKIHLKILYGFFVAIDKIILKLMDKETRTVKKILKRKTLKESNYLSQ